MQHSFNFALIRSVHCGLKSWYCVQYRRRFLQ